MEGATRDLLRCTLTPGLGPVLLNRLVEALGSYEALLAARASTLERVRGIGSSKAAAIVKGLRESERLADEELALADQLGVHLVAKGAPAYPALLTNIPGAPALLYVLGTFDPQSYGVAIVGSRGCTPYGIEQAERFASTLAGSGLHVISGGARGIDAAAHRGALRVNGITHAVLGCGLARRYPPEHTELFDAIVQGGGALISELPLKTNPRAENFPARNRVVSGMSLGVVVIEASAGSGALITARYANEEHGREVMALPGRVDSPASEGSLALLRSGEAALVTCAKDVIELLESPARHQHAGTHAHRFTEPSIWNAPRRPEITPAPPRPSIPLSKRPLPDDPAQCAVLNALDRPASLDQIADQSGLDPAAIRVAITMLELRGDVVRKGELLMQTPR